ELPVPSLGEGVNLEGYGSIQLTGSKDADTAVYVNGVEVVARNNATSWSYTPSWEEGEYGEKELLIKVVRGSVESAEMRVVVKRHGLGDITGDGRVNVVDLGVFAMNYEKEGITSASPLLLRMSDLTGDGRVNVFD